jgi:hypothetical protein
VVSFLFGQRGEDGPLGRRPSDVYEPHGVGSWTSSVSRTWEDVTYEGALIGYGIALDDGQRVLVREQSRDESSRGAVTLAITSQPPGAPRTLCCLVE